MIDILQTILLVFIAWFIVSGKSESFARIFTKQRKIILDSCALIDGRIVEIVNNGFVVDELVIPQFILNELQLLADGNDAHKRERARFGLDIAHQLQDTATARVGIDRSIFPEAKAIDDKLVLLARKLNACLYTTDYNLGKVASVEGVTVLNVNELAQSMRPITLPGETLSIKIIQKGSNRDQGVGYLEDGTMIVVDSGARYVGRTVPVMVTRMHQTVAGKMVFGQVREQREGKQRQAREERGHATIDRKDVPSAGGEQHEQVARPQTQREKLHSRLHRSLRRKKRPVL